MVTRSQVPWTGVRHMRIAVVGAGLAGLAAGAVAPAATAHSAGGHDGEGTRG